MTMTSNANLPLDTPGASKRLDLLRVARRHFLAYGYSATGMETIARDASVSTATLYAFFPSKVQLFDRVIQDATEEFARRISAAPSIEGGARQQLTTFATTYARFLGDPFLRALFRLVIAERRRCPDTATGIFERCRIEFGGQLIETVTQLNATGELRAEHPSWAAGQLMGMIEHPTFLMPLLTGDETNTDRDPEAVAADAVETFLARYAAS
jgi:AcrR family transcriptional regulator